MHTCNSLFACPLGPRSVVISLQGCDPADIVPQKVKASVLMEQALQAVQRDGGGISSFVFARFWLLDSHSRIALFSP